MSVVTEIIERTVIPSENLFMIKGKDQEDRIHRSIGAVTSQSNDRIIGGSGVLLSPNLVLTAAHNIYDRDEGNRNVNIKFYIPTNGVAKDPYQVEQVRYLPQFESCQCKQKLQYDYALLKLKRKVLIKQSWSKSAKSYFSNSPQPAFLPLTLPCSVCSLQKNINMSTQLEIYGYPSKKDGNYEPLDKQGNTFKLNQYGRSMKNRILGFNEKKCKIQYMINTLQGQSGCPIVVGQKIIGIHNGGGRWGEEYNVGRFVTFDMIDNIKKWIQQLKASKICIDYSNLCSHLQPNVKEHQIRNTFSLRYVQKHLKDVFLHKYINIQNLDLSSNQISLINIKMLVHLKSLKMQSNRLSSINLEDNKYLQFIYLSNNYLEKIDVSKITGLLKLNLGGNQLTDINVRNNTQLIWLDLSNNLLKAINLSHNKSLTNLLVSHNSLKQIDLIHQTKIINIDLSMNNLKISSLWLRSNILKEPNIDQKIDFSNQMFVENCQIQVMYRQIYSQKCKNIVAKWNQRYKQNFKNLPLQNVYNCSYTFLMILAN